MDHDSKTREHPPDILETQLGPVGAGLPSIPTPSEWPSAYGFDEAVAIAVVPERALVFWELAGEIRSGTPDNPDFRLTRLRLKGETPTKEKSWPVGPIGRFQDSGVEPGQEYLYVIARHSDKDDTPLLVTNPIRMPIRSVPGSTPSDLLSSLDLHQDPLKRALREEDR